MNKRGLINSLPVIAKMLGDKNKIKVRISGNSAYTDGDIINIPVLPDDADALILARGYIDHESGHVRMSDFEETKGREPVVMAIANALEDVRVEKAMGEIFPGCKRNLGDLAAYLAAKGAFSLPEEGEVPVAEAFMVWLIASLRSNVCGQTALHPVAEDAMECLQEIFSDSQLDELLDLAVEGSLAQSTKEVFDVAERVYQALKDWEQQQQQAISDGDSQSDQQQQGGSDGDSQGDQQQQGGSDGDSQGDQQGRSGGPPSRASGGLSELIKATHEDMGKTDMGEKIAQALTEMSAGKYSSLCVPSEERAPASKVDVSLVRKETAALRGRLAGLIQAARYQPSFPQKSGRRIEAGALPRLATKDPRVFRQEAEQVAVNTAVTILLDRSGSMCGDRLEVASQAALAAALALDSIPGVEVSAAAFPGSTGNNVISVMTAFGESARATAKNYGIASTGGTPTANALYWAGSRLANRPEPRKMVLVITDGDPNDLFAAIEARKTLETSKIEVFGIGIQVPTITSVFPKSRSINDVSALPSALFEVLRAELTKK